VGPSLHHYWCVQYYIPRIKAILNSDTVDFFPHATPFPEAHLKDYLKQSVSNIISILAKPPPTTSLSLTADITEDSQRKQKEFQIIKNKKKLPNPINIIPFNET